MLTGCTVDAIGSFTDAFVARRDRFLRNRHQIDAVVDCGSTIHRERVGVEFNFHTIFSSCSERFLAPAERNRKARLQPSDHASRKRAMEPRE